MLGKLSLDEFHQMQDIILSLVFYSVSGLLFPAAVVGVVFFRKDPRFKPVFKCGFFYPLSALYLILLVAATFENPWLLVNMTRSGVTIQFSNLIIQTSSVIHFEFSDVLVLLLILRETDRLRIPVEKYAFAIPLMVLWGPIGCLYFDFLTHGLIF